MIVVKRRGNLVIAYNICSIVLLIVGYPLTIVLYWCRGYIIPVDSTLFIALAVAAELMFTPWFFFSGVLKVFRYFMIYYDLGLAGAMQNLKWTRWINSNIEALKEQNFFVRHRRTIGNVSYMIKRIIFIFSVLSCGAMTSSMLYLFHVTDLQIWFFINSAVMIPTVASVVLIWKKCPYFNDNIFLYKEFQIISWCWGAALSVFFVTAGTTLIFGVNIVTRCFGYASGIFSAFVTPFASTFWVLRQMKMDKLVDYITRTSRTSTDLSMEEVLENKNIIQHFAAHLIENFCVESLLALIEFTQFKSYCKEHLGLEDVTTPMHTDHPEHLSDLDIIAMNIEDNVDGVETNEEEEDKVRRIKFPENVPKSDIVYSPKQSVDIKGFRHRAYKLYEKYIATDTEFQISISYETRRAMEEKMSDYQKWMSEENGIEGEELADIFDDAGREIMRLLESSKTRFRCE